MNGMRAGSKGLFLLTTAAMALVGVESAHAQASAPVNTREVVVTGTPDRYRATESSTAMKTDTPLIDVPQSITVMTRAQIEDQSLQSVSEVLRYSPGGGAQQGEGNRDAPIFRGNASTADLFVDGVRDDVEYFRDLYNVERVEVLRGPNGMIFGRGAVGGLINRVTRQANGKTFGEVTAQGSSEGGGRGTIDLGYAFDAVGSMRVTALYEDTESYRDDVTFERTGINPTLLLNLGARTSLRVGYEYYDYTRVADRGIPSLNGRPSSTSPSTFFGDPSQSPTTLTMNALTVAFEHEFSDKVRLTNKTRWADYDKFYQNVYASGPVSLTSTVPLQAYNQAQLRENLFNQTDLQIELETGSIEHTLLVGVEIGQQITDNRRDDGVFQTTGNPTSVTVPLANPRSTTPVVFSHLNSAAFNHIDASQLSVYVQDQLKFSPHWRVVLGVRYDGVDIEYTNRNTGVAVPRINTSDNLWSPRASLIFKPQDNISLYGSFTLSYLPRAGAQLASLTVANSTFDPEEWKNYEVGAKWDITPSLAATAAIYQLDRTNVIIADPANPTVSILADGQRARGVEIGLSGHITDAWSISGGYGWQEAEITAAPTVTTTGVVDGSRVGQTPEHTASLWNRYDFTPQWGAGLGVVYSSEQFAATQVAAAANNVVLPSYTRVDGALYWTINDKLRLQANVENLLDEEYFPNAHNNNNITPGSPRTYRVSMGVKF